MGRRPWKYLSAEERAEARREHVRQNVRAFRERNKAKKTESQSASKSQSPHDEQSTDLSSATNRAHPKIEPEHAEFGNRPPLTPASSSSSTSLVSLPKPAQQHIRTRPPSPVNTDFTSYSELAPIDVSFGTLQAIVEDLERVAPIWPWRLAARTLNSKDRLVDLGLLAAGYRILGKLRCDSRATAYAWRPYHGT